jgi:hypothetical protein
MFLGAGCGSDDNPPVTDASTEGDTGGFDMGPCEDGDIYCDGDTVYECEGGTWQMGEDCSESGQVCAENLGCVECLPNRPFCEGEVSMMCNEDGSGATVNEDCSLQPGSWCDEASGLCIDECDEAAQEKSNVGCEYWLVDLDNAENKAGDDAAAAQFAVAVANVNNVYAADVTIYADTSGYGDPTVEMEVDSTTISPGMIHVFNLPRYDVDGPNVTNHVDDGPQTCLSKRTFRLVSTVPVVAYQFNPIDQQFSNDASLLLPVSGLGDLYHVVGWRPAHAAGVTGFSKPNRSYVTIVGVSDATTVTVHPTFDVGASVPPIPAGFGSVPELTVGGEYEFTLNRYEVLNLESKAAASLAEIPTANIDPTGTIVESTRPVAVFSGVDLAGVGGEVMPPECTGGESCGCCMEHLEMQVIPKVAMGKRFVVSHSPFRGSSFIEPDHYRVLAVRDGTHVTTSLSGGFSSFDLDTNEWFDFWAQSGFTLESSMPVQVVQLLVVQEQTQSVIGDPTMVPFPAVEERRSFYVFTTGLNFSQHWAVISMPEGTSALLDGEDVETTCERQLDGDLGGQTYYSYYCSIEEGVQHVVDAGDQPVGVTVYGYYGAGSYGYPGGSDLREIFLE